MPDWLQELARQAWPAGSLQDTTLRREEVIPRDTAEALRVQALDSQGLVDPTVGALMAASSAVGAPNRLMAIAAFLDQASKTSKRPESNSALEPYGADFSLKPRQSGAIAQAVNRVINRRNTVFHATDLDSANKILQTEHIAPQGRIDFGDLDPKQVHKLITRLRTIKAEQDALLFKRDKLYRTTRKPSPDLDNKAAELQGESRSIREVLDNLGFNETSGVSVSRVPKVASKDTKAISLVIDQSKMPKTRPLAESYYGKTKGTDLTSKPNPQFEFENRTYGQSIPAEAIKEIWVDKKALSKDPKTAAELNALGKPIREFASGRQIHAGRVLEAMAEKDLWDRFVGKRVDQDVWAQAKAEERARAANSSSIYDIKGAEKYLQDASNSGTNLPAEDSWWDLLEKLFKAGN